ncbi:Beta-ketoacyl synthase, C-terminal domain [Streptomyces sp. 1222.2]|nr:Beta-ketoacyl synthase, C-terminal domain [Streptomyces sp. 1222.2]
MPGPLFGAAGALGALAAVLSLRERTVPPTINLDDQDPRIGLDIVTGRPRGGPYTAALANAFGFGGHNTCLVLPP